MHKATLYRFAILHNIPVSDLNHVLVDQLVGSNKDIRKTYKQLEALTTIREHAKSVGITLADVLSLIDSQKQP